MILGHQPFGIRPFGLLLRSTTMASHSSEVAAMMPALLKMAANATSRSLDSSSASVDSGGDSVRWLPSSTCSVLAGGVGVDCVGGDCTRETSLIWMGFSVPMLGGSLFWVSIVVGLKYTMVSR